MTPRLSRPAAAVVAWCSRCRSRSAPRAAADGDHSTFAVWLILGAIVGFVLGAGCAAWLQRTGTPLSHGLVTATATYLVAQAVFISFGWCAASDVHWFAILFNLTFVASPACSAACSASVLRRRGSCPPRTHQEGSSSASRAMR